MIVMPQERKARSAGHRTRRKHKRRPKNIDVTAAGKLIIGRCEGCLREKNESRRHGMPGTHATVGDPFRAAHILYTARPWSGGLRLSYHARLQATIERQTNSTPAAAHLAPLTAHALHASSRPLPSRMRGMHFSTREGRVLDCFAPAKCRRYARWRPGVRAAKAVLSRGLASSCD